MGIQLAIRNWNGFFFYNLECWHFKYLKSPWQNIFYDRIFFFYDRIFSIGMLSWAPSGCMGCLICAAQTVGSDCIVLGRNNWNCRNWRTKLRSSAPVPQWRTPEDLLRVHAQCSYRSPPPALAEVPADSFPVIKHSY